MDHAGGGVLAHRLGAAADLEAFQAADHGDQEGKQRNLLIPTRKCCTPIPSSAIDRNIAGGMSRVRHRNGHAADDAAEHADEGQHRQRYQQRSTRSTSSSMGLRPRARIASISSLALHRTDLRGEGAGGTAAMRIAVSSTANSRRKENTTGLTV